MPILLLLLLVGGALALASSKGTAVTYGARNPLTPLEKLSFHVAPGVVTASGYDASLTADQASAIHTAVLHETSANRLSDFAASLPPGMPLAYAALMAASHNRAVASGTTSVTTRNIPGMF